jgi:hypothetical protein
MDPKELIGISVAIIVLALGVMPMLVSVVTENTTPYTVTGYDVNTTTAPQTFTLSHPVVASSQVVYNTSNTSQILTAVTKYNITTQTGALVIANNGSWRVTYQYTGGTYFTNETDRTIMAAVLTMIMLAMLVGVAYYIYGSRD